MNTIFNRCFATLSIVIVLSMNLYAIDVLIKGRIRYYDANTDSYKPVANAQIQILTFEPTVTPAPVLYTDNNGNFSKWLGVYPEQVTVYVFFKNSKINLRGAITTRSESITALKTIRPACPNPAIPCYPWLTPPDFENMNLDLTGDNANYALIFDHANKAADFSIAQGFTPAQCNVKYPLQSSIVNQVWVSASGSFFWPFETMSTNSAAFQAIANAYLPIIPLVASLFGYSGEMTENAIYINDLVKYNVSTVYNEYGHFIMKQKRSNWPVSKTEYVDGDVPISHNSGDSQQNSRQAYLEGWADFYKMAVLGWGTNPSVPYSVTKPYVGHVSNGYNHELTIGNAFWDFYDPLNDENFQTSYANISNVMGEKQNLMSEFISMLAHKSYLTDQQRNAGIYLMTLNKMSAVTSYGNATMYVKNDFNGGIVNINGGDINTSSPTYNGVYSTTELWMSTKPLRAKEQMYDGYQRLFKHTNPDNLSANTWTTNDQQKNNHTEIWNTYTDALTYTANFDKLCNVTYILQGIESGVISGSTNPYRSGKVLTFNSSDFVQNGITYKFLNWSDGSTANPRTEVINAHGGFTATYKGSLASSTTAAIANTGQRKVASVSQDYYGCTHYVYESGGYVWHERVNPSGVTVSVRQIGQGKNPSIAPINDVYYSTQVSYGAVIVYQTTEEPGTIRYATYNASTGGYYNDEVFYDIGPSTVNANPVVASTFPEVCVVFQLPSIPGYSPGGNC